MNGAILVTWVANAAAKLSYAASRPGCPFLNWGASVFRPFGGSPGFAFGMSGLGMVGDGLGFQGFGGLSGFLQGLATIRRYPALLAQASKFQAVSF